MRERCSHCGAPVPGPDDVSCPECHKPAPDEDPAFVSEIDGLEGMTNEQVLWELHHGGKFVVYQYCVSLLVVTFYRPSRVHFIRSHESAILKGMKYTLLSLVAGWWGIPLGPFCTIAAIVTNLCGGRNITPTTGMTDALRHA